MKSKTNRRNGEMAEFYKVQWEQTKQKKVYLASDSDDMDTNRFYCLFYCEKKRLQPHIDVLMDFQACDLLVFFIFPTNLKCIQKYQNRYFCNNEKQEQEV